MRVAFMGTPDFALPSLDMLIGEGHDVAAVYTRPPRPAGRGKSLRPSPVQQRAEAAGIEVRTPMSLRDTQVQDGFRALGVEAAVVAAYGLILPKPILEVPPYGCINVHASLLPRWRGAAPVQRAILAGDPLTGVTIMKMDEGLDTGAMMAVWPVEAGRKTAGELTDELAKTGAWLLAAVLDRIDTVGPRPQPERGVAHAPKVTKEEARLDFSGSAEQAERQVRAFNPVPGAWFGFAGERVKVLAAEVVERAGEPGTVIDDALTIACAEGALAPTLVQRAGRAAMSPAELLRGFSIPRGARLE